MKRRVLEKSNRQNMFYMLKMSDITFVPLYENLSFVLNIGFTNNFNKM